MNLGKKMLVASALACSVCAMGAQESMAFSHYVPGTLGVKNGTIPPEGLWWENYNQFYVSDTINDGSGDEIKGLGWDLLVYANVTHVAYMFNVDALGGDYGVDIFVPFLYSDVEMTAAGIDDDQFGLGDIFIDPLVMGWHGKRYDAFLSAGVYMPTGDDDGAAAPGKGYWTFMEQAGGTLYADEERTWSFSGRFRLLQSTEDPDTDITPGDELHFEYGVAKTLALSNSTLLTLGVGGYSYFQTSSDSGPGADDSKESGHSLGLDVSLFIPSKLLNIALRYMPEYAVENAAEGASYSLVLSGSF